MGELCFLPWDQQSLKARNDSFSYPPTIKPGMIFKTGVVRLPLPFSRRHKLRMLNKQISGVLKFH